MVPSYVKNNDDKSHVEVKLIKFSNLNNLTSTCDLWAEKESANIVSRYTIRIVILVYQKLSIARFYETFHLFNR